MLAALPPLKRLDMVADLWATSRALVRAGVVSRQPHATEAEIQKQVFLRFYEHDLPRPLIDRVLRGIDEQFAATPTD